MPYRDKEKHAALNRKWNKTPQGRQYYRERMRQRRARIALLKNKPCADCRRRYPSECMDFDHVRGRKLFNVSHMFRAFMPSYKIKREIAKCDLVCANCHRIRTTRRKRR